MRLVIVESPFAGPTVGKRNRNLKYARAALADCFARGEAPFASHLLYTQPGVLDDEIAWQRDLGIRAGLAWGLKADATVVYIDLGVSGGMRAGITAAEQAGRPVERRSLPGWGPPPDSPGNPTACQEANVTRSAAAAARTVAQARAILDAGAEKDRREREVLEARVKWPTYSLAEIGRELGMTKAAYWSALRRALAGREVA